MNNRTKKEQKLSDEVTAFIILVSGVIGWLMTESLKGVGVAVGVGFVVLLAFGVWRTTCRKKRMKASSIEEIDNMTGRQFEEYVGTLFSSFGYDVTYTPTTGDYGADLLLKKGKEVIVVQAKRYKKSVGVKAVQEVLPAVKFYKADATWVITNSTYTKQALMLAKHNDVRMIDREALIRLSIQMKKETRKSN
ncbi:restriction endonuclease [Sporosarcina sp. P16b]|uniref:restriction endonuclease n=1 Tax=Sporosarcina sp. P16b TaxID=2048261 RepID=UPI001E3FACDA|nr:restriction endonuclease [Sporosarcina sp. P16b]